MIRHTVSFSLEHPRGSDAEALFLEAAKVLTQIPQVRNFEQLRQVSAKADFAFCLSMEFENQEAYDAYNAHPVHVAFVRDRWIPEVADFLEQDFIRVEEEKQG